MKKRPHPLRTFYQDIMARVAIVKQDFELLKQALIKGANPDARMYPCTSRTERLIHHAVLNKWAEGVTLLLKCDADPEIRAGRHRATAFYLATDAQDAPTMRTLAEHGADPDGKGAGADMIAAAKALDSLGWDYPSQASLVQYREMTVRYLMSDRGDPTQKEIFALAEARHAVQQCLNSLEKHTPMAIGSRTTARL